MADSMQKPDLDRRKMAVLIEDSDFALFKLTRLAFQQPLGKASTAATTGATTTSATTTATTDATTMMAPTAATTDATTTSAPAAATTTSAATAVTTDATTTSAPSEYLAKFKIPVEKAQQFLHYWLYLARAEDKAPANTHPASETVTIDEYTKALSQAPASELLKSDGLEEMCWRNNARKYRVMQDLGLTPLALLEKFEAEARPSGCGSQAEPTIPSHSDHHIRVATLRIAYQCGPRPLASRPSPLEVKVLPEQYSVYTLAELLCAKYVELTRPGDGCVFEHMWTLSAGAPGAGMARRDKLMRLTLGLPRTLYMYASDLIYKLERDGEPLTYVGPHSASRELGIPVTEKRPGPVLSSAFPSWGKGASFSLMYDMGTESHFNITCLDEGTMLATDWARSISTDPALAFAEGDRVQVKMSSVGWQDGTITSLWFKGGLYSIKMDKTAKETEEVDRNGDKVVWVPPNRALAAAALRLKPSAQPKDHPDRKKSRLSEET